MNNTLQILSNINVRLSVDEGLYRHSHNVSLYAMYMHDLFLNYGVYDINKYNNLEFLYAGLLHDVGKSDIPCSILNAERPLTYEEREIIKSHVILGEKYVDGLRDISDINISNILDGVRYHHERWDGKGYYDKLKGLDIPLIARVLSIADVFDALMSKRCYKRAWTYKDTLNTLQSDSGGLFDPVLIDIIVENPEYLQNIKDYLSII